MLSYIQFYNTIISQIGGKKNTKKYWDTLTHNGVMFPEEYKPINVPIIYDGKEILLNPEAEEAATFYAKYIKTEYDVRVIIVAGKIMGAMKRPIVDGDFRSNVSQGSEPEVHELTELEGRCPREFDMSLMCEGFEI